MTSPRMANPINLTLTADEAEIVIDALEADLEDYLESAQEARDQKNRQDAEGFTEAAERVEALLATLRKLLPEEASPDQSRSRPH